MKPAANTAISAPGRDPPRAPSPKPGSKGRHAADDFDVYVGGRIRMARLTMPGPPSQTSFGKTLGVTFQQIQKYELGSNRTSTKNLTEIARITGKPLMWFLPGAPDESETPADTAASDVIMELAKTRDGVALAAAFVRLTGQRRSAVLHVAQELADLPASP